MIAARKYNRKLLDKTLNRGKEVDSSGAGELKSVVKQTDGKREFRSMNCLQLLIPNPCIPRETIKAFHPIQEGRERKEQKKKMNPRNSVASIFFQKEEPEKKYHERNLFDRDRSRGRSLRFIFDICSQESK